MGDQVGFDVARRRRLPVGERPDRHDAPNGRLGQRPLAGPAACRQAYRGQEAIDGRGAHRQHVRADLGVEVQMPMMLQRGHQDLNQRLEAFAAHPVGRLPKHDERIGDGLVIDTAVLGDGSRRAESGGLI